MRFYGLDPTTCLLNSSLILISCHRDFTQHTHRRRAFAPHYTLDNITSLYQHDMKDFANTLLDGLQNIAGNRAVDCTSMFRHLLVNVIMLATLDQRPKSTEKWSTGVVDPVSVAINDWPKRGLLVRSSPLLHRLARSSGSYSHNARNRN